MSDRRQVASRRAARRRCRTRADHFDRERRLHELLRQDESVARAHRSGPAVAIRRLRPGDVVLGMVPYTDGTGEKLRPVVVLDATGGGVLGAACTSRLRHAGRPGYLPIGDLTPAGLSAASLVNTVHLVTLTAADLRTHLGRCSERDWEDLQQAVGERRFT